MGQINELKDFTRGQLDAALMKIGKDAGTSTAEGIERFNRGELKVVANEPAQSSGKRTLRVLRPVEITFRSFKAEETFFGETAVEVAYRGSNFTTWLKTVVENTPSHGELDAFTLSQSMSDSEILDELGGEARVEVVLSQVWRLLERQPKGEEGVLLTNGYANIFYVRDMGGVLRTVHVNWGSDGWRFYANALDDDRWDDAYRVFSRNS